jgi:CheY-like chemotaxis protein
VKLPDVAATAETERPTIRPAFDPASYARDSEARLRASSARACQSHERLKPLRACVRLAVLVVDSDPVGRSAIVRGLLRGQCQVTAVATLEDLDEALGSEEVFDSAVMSAEHPALRSILETLVAVHPSLPVVALAMDVPVAVGSLRDAGVVRFAVCPRETATEVLLDALYEQIAGA